MRLTLRTNNKWFLDSTTTRQPLNPNPRFVEVESAYHNKYKRYIKPQLKSKYTILVEDQHDRSSPTICGAINSLRISIVHRLGAQVTNVIKLYFIALYRSTHSCTVNEGGVTVECTPWSTNLIKYNI